MRIPSIIDAWDIKERRKQVKQFVDFLNENPDIEAEYVRGIRFKARLNVRAMKQLYTDITDTKKNWRPRAGFDIKYIEENDLT